MSEKITRYCSFDAKTFEVIGFYSSEFPKVKPMAPFVEVALDDIDRFNDNGFTHVAIIDDEFDSFHLVNTVSSNDELNVIATKSRQHAYATESDPLFMEWQYEKTPESEQAWLSKVTEIKQRYPLIK